jgi:hypothetical protein
MECKFSLMECKAVESDQEIPLTGLFATLYSEKKNGTEFHLISNFAIGG